MLTLTNRTKEKFHETIHMLLQLQVKWDDLNINEQKLIFMEVIS